MNLVRALTDHYDDALYRKEISEQDHQRTVAALDDLTPEALEQKLRRVHELAQPTRTP
jgi:hypothetical protein